MSAWQTVDTLQPDGRQVLFWSPLGKCYIAPAEVLRPPSREEMRRIYEETGDWPNVGWNATHWMELPDDPKIVPLVPPAD